MSGCCPGRYLVARLFYGRDEEVGVSNPLLPNRDRIHRGVLRAATAAELSAAARSAVLPVASASGYQSGYQRWPAASSLEVTASLESPQCLVILASIVGTSTIVRPLSEKLWPSNLAATANLEPETISYSATTVQSWARQRRP